MSQAIRTVQEAPELCNMPVRENLPVVSFVASYRIPHGMRSLFMAGSRVVTFFCRARHTPAGSAHYYRKSSRLSL